MKLDLSKVNEISSLVVNLKDVYFDRFIKIVSTFLIFIAVFLAFQQLFKTIFSPFSVDEFIKVQTVKINPKKETVGYLVNNPFNSNNKNYVLSEVVIDAPETTLGLTLYGITFYEESKNSSAILGFNSNQQRSYKVGDEISNGVLIDFIEKDRVIINRGGNQESVVFDNKSIIAFTDTKKVKTDTKRTRDPNPIKEETLLNELFSFVPYYKNGNLKGYEIFPGTNKKLFEENGFQSGDIVIAVNGISVNSPSIVSTINTKNKASIDLLRNEESLSIELEL